ncbi:MAG: OmpP1/FadL family transporter [Kiritimatiellia bacterium]
MGARVGCRGMRWAWAIAACAAVGAGAGEANYQPYIVGERAAGMGGAVAATADGMDACFYNPAGLGHETRDSISVNGTLYGIQTYEMEDAAYPGEDMEVSSFATIPTGLSMVRKLRDGTTAAFSVFVPSQSSAREIKAFPERQHYYNYSQDEQTIYLGPSLGRMFSERLALGVSVLGTYQTASELQNLYWGDYAYTYTANYKYSVIGVVGTLGAQYRLADEWTAGLVFTTPSATLTGNGTVQLSEVVGDADYAASGAVYYDDLDADNGLPAQLRAGLAWRRSGVGSVGFDVTHHFSSSYDWMSGTQDGEAVVIRQEREAVTDFQLGGEYVYRERYPLRAGAFTSFSSAPDLAANGDSQINQVDLYGVTASVGSVGENVVVNFGLSYVWGEGDALGTRLDADGALESFVSRTRESGLYAFASTAYRF